MGWINMGEVGLCAKDLQHCWVSIPSKGMPCHSCPLCGKLVYWSETLLAWVKPGTSGNKPIPGNKQSKEEL